MGHGHKKIRRRRKFRKAARVFGWAFLVLFIGSVFWLGLNWGPGAPLEGPVEVEAESSDELVEESRELENRFEAIAADGEPGESDLELLREALALQEQFNRANRGSREGQRRAADLESRLSHFIAADLRAQSAAAEERGAEMRSEGNIEEASTQFARAYELQREINRRHSSSRFRDTTRENRLQQMQVVLRVEPLSERSREIEREGRQALNAEDWDDARRLLSEARDLQVEINDAARRTRFYDAGRVSRLNNDIESIEIGEMATRVRQLREEASTFSAGGQANLAADQFAQAYSLQRQINREFPQSRFASSRLANELEVEVQTARSAEGARQLEERVRRLRGALAAGDIEQARSEIEPAKRLTDQLFDRYPRSLHVDSELRIELEYLAIVQPALENLQAVLTEGLLPIPGMEGWTMLRTEVPQSLYQTVMNANPSRNRGADLPVDSVTFRQANDFCRRASWILGRPVQLITRSQYMAALGEWEPEGVLVAEAEEIREVRSGEPNPNGFYHLVGNIGQWLQPNSSENGSGWIAGGVVELEDDLSGLVRQVDLGERSPDIGFRFAVHADPR